MAWMRSTSGRMALRVQSMCLRGPRRARFWLAGVVQRGQLFSGLAHGLLYALRGSAAGDIMALEHGFQLELLVDVRAKRRAEFVQLFERQILELAASGKALLHRMGHDLVCLTERNAGFYQIGRRRQGIHEAALARGLHAIVV